MARAFLIALVSLLVVAGCDQLDSLLGREEQQGSPPKQGGKQGSKQGSAPTTRKFDPKGVGATAEVGSFLVTLNNAKGSSGASQDKGADTQDHYYAVADLTLENRAEAPLGASEADYLLRDEEGYSFE
jgi:hypothetical protein